MSPEYAVGLAGVFASLCAIAAFVWAIRHRQLQSDDEAMYGALSDDEPDYTESPPNSVRLPRRARWILAIVLTAIFILVAGMVTETIMAASHAPYRITPAARTSPDWD
jgi:nitrogen fixation-related uncharacterized protein